MGILRPALTPILTMVKFWAFSRPRTLIGLKSRDLEVSIRAALGSSAVYVASRSAPMHLAGAGPIGQASWHPYLSIAPATGYRRNSIHGYNLRVLKDSIAYLKATMT